MLNGIHTVNLLPTRVPGTNDKSCQFGISPVGTNVYRINANHPLEFRRNDIYRKHIVPTG